MKQELLHKKLSFVNVRELIEWAGENYESKIAYSYRPKPLKDEVTRITFPQLRLDVRSLASAMLDMGCSGKHIALVGQFSYEWALVYFATMSIGAVLVPLDSEWTKEDLAKTISYADCDFLFIEKAQTEKAEYISNNSTLAYEPFLLSREKGEFFSALVEKGRSLFFENPEKYFETRISPDDLSLLVFTSGTTGKGKGVMLSQTSILSDITNVMPYIDYGEKTVNVLPMHHTYGSTVMLLGHTAVGAEIYISAGIRYVAKELIKEQPEHLVLVPLYLETFHRKIIANIKEKGIAKQFAVLQKTSETLRKIGIDTRQKLFESVRKAFGGKLRTVICGGAPLNQDILHFFESVGLSVLNGYGITECSPIIAVNRSNNVVDASVGNVLDINKVKIDKPDNEGIGEILVKGENVMLGYYKDEEATHDAINSDGYFKTGDYGKLTEDNILYITGRKKNLIILSNGKNVYPEEIENHISSIEGTLDVVVYEGQSKRGLTYNAIVAEIYPDKEYFEKNSITDLQSYYTNHIGEYNKTAVPYKKVGVVRIRETEFPKNTLRKIKRFELNTTIE